MSKACKRLIKRKHLCIWQHSEKSFWFSNIFRFNMEFGCASVHYREIERERDKSSLWALFAWLPMSRRYCLLRKFLYCYWTKKNRRAKKRVQIEQRIWKIQTELDCRLNRLNVSMDAYHVCVRLRSRVCMRVRYAFSNISTSKFSLVVKKREANTMEMARIIKLHKWKIEMS